MTNHHHDYKIAAKKIIEQVGKKIFIAVPLGIGKPIGLLNALYQLASDDASLTLTVITGLTLARPTLKNELEKRLIEPILDRILKDYEDPLYEQARIKEQLPKNINVIEFFLTPGNYLNNHYVQQNYCNSTYSNAVRDALTFPINVLAQQVVSNQSESNHYSLSCNSDLFHDMREHLKKYAEHGRKIAIVAELNEHLPYMYGKAVIEEEIFSDIIDTGHYHHLFAIPREKISIQDHLIGLYTSALIKDGGCLQIGIGKLSNAVANALIARHQHNDLYTDTLNELKLTEKFGDIVSVAGGTTVFDKGLYASTEMLSDEYLQLYKTGILKKRVYDHIGLQKLLNIDEIREEITPDILDILLKHKLINPNLSSMDVNFLKEFGVFKPDVNFQEGTLILSTGERIVADLLSSAAKTNIIQKCLGDHLSSGKIIHAGFFVGSVCLYAQLKNLSRTELLQIDMTSISRTNSLLWAPELLTLQRQQARFVNSALMITLGGVCVSDGLKNYQELSGVGGQFDFVNMASQLPDARSIINCHSTRDTKKGIVSNIVWDYPNSTIPRYLRDIIVTEYGIADCRGKVDSEVIKAILNITDSRFQNKLLEAAKKAGKISHDYEIPKHFQNNHLEELEKMMHQSAYKKYCMPYPFGSDLTEDEQVIADVLLEFKYISNFKIIMLLLTSLLFFRSDTEFEKYLERMQLKRIRNVKDYFYKKLLKYLIYKYRQK